MIVRPVMSEQGHQPGTELGAEALFRSHAAFVASFLVRIGAARSEIEDLVQEVFLVVHRRGGFICGEAKPTTWLAKIAVRTLANLRRTQRRRPLSFDAGSVDTAETATAGPFDQVSSRRSLERVQGALESLDIDLRAVFVLFELEGESCASIAAGLDIPVGTVYSRLHRAREQFRTAYDRRGKPASKSGWNVQQGAVA